MWKMLVLEICSCNRNRLILSTMCKEIFALDISIEWTGGNLKEM
jgi:hypothetical protein